ncbi:hypothetical protein LABO110987_06565 [Lactobacillus bombicola]
MENGVGNNLLRAAIDDGRQVGLLPVKFELGHVGIPFVLGVNRPKIVLDQVGLNWTLGAVVAVILAPAFTNQTK